MLSTDRYDIEVEVLTTGWSVSVTPEDTMHIKDTMREWKRY